MDWKPKYKPMTKVTEVDKGNYLCLVNGKVVKSVSLEKSRAVRARPLTKNSPTIFASSDPSQNKPSARVNLKTRRTLDRGIQLYRLWFNFLKLALELEEQGVSIVTKNHTIIKNTSNPDEPIPDKVLRDSEIKLGGSKSSGMGGSHPIFRCKRIQKVKVKRGAYKGWDLDRVLSEDFNTWWFGHESWGYKWKKVGNKK